MLATLFFNVTMVISTKLEVDSYDAVNLFYLFMQICLAILDIRMIIIARRLLDFLNLQLGLQLIILLIMVASFIAPYALTGFKLLYDVTDYNVLTSGIMLA